MKKAMEWAKTYFRPLRVIFIVVWLVLGAIIWYFDLPALSLRSDGFWWFLFVMLLIASIMALIAAFVYYDEESYPFTWGIWMATGAILSAIIVIALVGSQLNARVYRDTMEVQEADFQADFQNIIETGKPLTMDYDTAWSLGDRVLGSIPNATLYDVDGYTLQVYDGRATWVGSLKYRTMRQPGIPGYILVDVSSSTAKFVELEKPIRFDPSAYWGNNLKRHLRGQFPGFVYESHLFEIDETGHPFWVTAVSEPQAGLWGCRKVTAAIVTDAISGESQLYKLADVPEWVDNVMSLDYLMERTQWHFTFQNGWWTGQVLGRIEKLSYEYKGSDFAGYMTYVGPDGHVKVITGVTPANRTESNSGFLTVDMRTGEVRYYAISGAEESSAMDAAEDLIRETQFQATFPVMMNLGGEPVYFMQMKGRSAGLIQRYAFVDYKDRTKVFVGATYEETLAGFLKLKGMSATSVGTATTSTDTVASTTSISGVIDEKYQAEIEGTTVFYYRIGDKLYKAPITVEEYQVLLKTGDQVEFEYVDGEVRQVVQIKLN